jgi:hypothetical protein
MLVSDFSGHGSVKTLATWTSGLLLVRKQFRFAKPTSGVSADDNGLRTAGPASRPKRLTAVVDVGANPLDSDGAPPYKRMLTRFQSRPVRSTYFDLAARCIHELAARSSTAQNSLDQYLKALTRR